MRKEVIIIGGGVSGITTALTLQLLGFKTTCYAEHLVDEHAPEDPLFASLYPAASIIPHSVKTDKLSTLFPASLKVFEALYPVMESVVKHRHFELFEFPQQPPAYTKYLHHFSTLKDAQDQTIPQRSDATDLHGWVFDCFMASWPQYMHQLYTLYKQAGGIIKKQKVNLDDIARLPAETIINCTGAWSKELFKDNATLKLIRGHLVHILKKDAILDKLKRPCSYNYTPLSKVYATPDGLPSDVYFYPVKDKWILGGSRQHGNIDEHKNWTGANHHHTTSINNVNVPHPILDLNADILDQTYGIKLDQDVTNIQAKVGYRFSRNHTQNGLRLEASQAFGKRVIHNYGHGGAGVCLSWGCALHVYHLVIKEMDADFSSLASTVDASVINSLQVELQKVYWKYIHS